MPREGVFTRVLKGGKVSVGDEMTVDKAMIFDTHAHYDDEAFDEDRFAMLESMQENGIGHIVDVCVLPWDILTGFMIWWKSIRLFMVQWGFIRMMRIR